MRILDIVIVVLLVMWLGGFALDVAGGLIHLILLVAGIVFIARLIAR